MVTAAERGLNRRVGQRVRALRRLRRLTQEQLAERIERSVDTVSSIERGKVAPGLETLVRLATALEVTVLELLDVGTVRSVSPVRAGVMAEVMERLHGFDDHRLHLAARLMHGLADG